MRGSQQRNFDAWSELARRDPVAFEARRRQAIEAAIRLASPKRQATLRRLQWRIDGVRRASPNPLAAAIRMSAMMHDSLAALHRALTLSAPPAVRPRGTSPARVLRFPPRR